MFASGCNRRRRSTLNEVNRVTTDPERTPVYLPRLPRPTRHRPFAALALIIVLALTGMAPAGAETGPMSAESDGARLDALGLDSDLYAAVKLNCHGHLGDDGPAVGCEWKRHHDDADVRAWQLWNLQVRPETGVRNLVTEVGADVTAARDTNVVAPATYLYAVIGLNGEGEVVTRSRVVAVRLGEPTRPEVEQLRLDCVGQDTDAGPVVGCDWSGVELAPAVEYKLFRVTERHDRRVVATTGLDQTSYRDSGVHYGTRYRYWVIGVDEHGNIVAASRSSVAGVEAPDREVDAVREIDAEPVRDVESARDAERDRPVDRPDDRVRDRDTDRPLDRRHDH